MNNPFLDEGLADILKQADDVVASQEKQRVSGKIAKNQKHQLTRRPKGGAYHDQHKEPAKSDSLKVYTTATQTKRNALERRQSLGSRERLDQMHRKAEPHEPLHGRLLNLSQEQTPSNLDEINEPKREPTSLSQIGVRIGGGVQNILAVLAAASESEKEFWATWYQQAQGEVKALAAKYDLNWKLVAAAVAALSPGSKWATNMLSAERIIQLFLANPHDDLDALMARASSIKAQTGVGIPAYEDNRKKAFIVLKTGDLSKIQTRKVWVFYKGLIDPDGVEKEIEDGSIDAKHRKMLSRKTTVDGHAINVWRGYKQPLDAMDRVSEEEFDRIANDYEAAAKISGLSTRALQAITWYIWKYTQDVPPPDRIPLKSLDAKGQPQHQEPSKQLTKLISRFAKKGTPLPGVAPVQTASRGPGGVWRWSNKTEAMTDLSEEMALVNWDLYLKLVAEAYEAAPVYDPAALSSYRAVVRDVDNFFPMLKSKVDVQFVDYDPYRNEGELRQDIEKNKVLRVMTGHSEHPVFTPQQNWKFRAVHDWFTHAIAGKPFSPKGEIAAYNTHARMFSREALPALFTEIVGQVSYLAVKGHFPVQKVALLKGFDYRKLGAVDNYEVQHKQLVPVVRAAF